MEFLSKLLGFIPKKIDKIYKKGMRFYNKLEYIEAIQYFEQMLAEEGLSKFLEYKLASFYCGLAYRNLGVVEFAKNNNKQALFNFKMALQYNPKHIDLNYFIGICLNNIGDFQGAMESFKITSANFNGCSTLMQPWLNARDVFWNKDLLCVSCR